MTDDLVKRLREYCDGNNDLMDAAADRIEKLELIVWQLEVELDNATEELMELRGDK